jgi:hypothetical protein
MYFLNGGGPCYVISVSGYQDSKPKVKLSHLDETVDSTLGGLAVARKIDEITLLVFPDAPALGNNNFYSLYQAALKQCSELKDRFTLIDVKDSSSPIEAFRTNVGNNNLNYGAAYYPNLSTTLSYQYDSEGLDKCDLRIMSASDDTNRKKLIGQFKTEFESKKRVCAVLIVSDETITPKNWTISGFNDAGRFKTEKIDDPESELSKELIKDNPDNFKIIELATQILGRTRLLRFTRNGLPLPEIEVAKLRTNTQFIASLERLISGFPVTLPPSGTMAGVYAQVDRTRGVFKAPANISLNSVIAPTHKISDEEQQDLNVHTSGKSINAIRSFAGKGILAWGARTLEGNSNEWRYVSVRRFFLFVEESLQKAIEPFVFEGNNETTWIRIKGLIDNFLTSQWRAGALFGTTPEQAFFVNIGLGITMSAQDVLEGRLIVEIGMAAVRPAEFIILRFTHKVQEA